MHEIIKHTFKISILFVLLLSFYFFIDTLVFKNKEHSTVFSNWQFPMLLALFVDTIYGL